MAQAMIRSWFTVFDAPAVVCSDEGTQFFGAWFCALCKYMGVKHAKTVAYHSRSNARVEVGAGNFLTNSGNCILRSLAEMSTLRFEGFCRHTTIYNRLVYPPLVSH